MRHRHGTPVWLALLAAAVPALADAQGVEVVGTRALGMGGAFVAVADDASAVYWNPAGLATGAFFSATIDGGGHEAGDVPVAQGGSGAGLRGNQLLIAAGTLPIALSYLRLDSSSAAPGGEGGPGRIAALTTNQVGLTLVHSLVQGFVVAGSLKVVHGSAGAGVPGGVGVAADLLDEADRLDRAGSTTLDADVGVMGAFGVWRLGLVARNLAAPEFDGPAGVPAGRLERQVRAGVAWLPSRRVTVAVDADLTTVGAASGERRNVAAGVETWWLERRVALRGGVRASTVGEVRPAGSLGGSVAIWKLLYADGQWTAGGDASDRGWSLAARIAY
jgi:hypothetical protein